MSITTGSMTAADLEAKPDDGHRYELVRGVLIRMCPVNYTHSTLSHLVSFYLNEFVLPRGLGSVGGEGGFILENDPDTVRAPDVEFVRADREPQGEAANHFANLAPDLAGEVRSPSESLTDLFDKADEYIAAGTRLVWIFDPGPKRVYVRRPHGNHSILDADDTLDGEDVLVGFILHLRKIFPE